MLASANMVNDPLIDRLKNKLKEAASELMRTLNENMQLRHQIDELQNKNTRLQAENERLLR